MITSVMHTLIGRAQWNKGSLHVPAQNSVSQAESFFRRALIAVKNHVHVSGAFFFGTKAYKSLEFNMQLTSKDFQSMGLHGSPVPPMKMTSLEALALVRLGYCKLLAGDHQEAGAAATLWLWWNQQALHFGQKDKQHI